MGDRPKKISNYVGFKQAKVERYIEDFDKDLKNLFNFLAINPKFYNQNSEPTLKTNDWCFWLDADGVAYYLVANFNGTQKKVALT